MSKDDLSMAEAATAVMKTLEPLGDEDRARVLQSAAALYGIGGNFLTPGSSKVDTQHVEPSGPADIPSSAARGASGKKKSIGEFIREKLPTTNPQRLACFAYYRENVEGHSHFSKADLLPYFAAAKLTPPTKNFARDYGAAVKQAWLHDAGDKSYLTAAGEEAVVTGFSGQSAPRGRKPGKKKPKKA